MQNNKTLWILFAGFALAYLVSLPYRPYPAHFLLKALPILLLAFYAYRNLSSAARFRICIGLLFSALGDILLALPFPPMFLAGLVAFLTAHLFYISVFYPQPVFSLPRLFLVGLGLIYGIIIGTLLFPVMGKLIIPVMSYLCVILVMAFTAVLGRNNHPLIAVGAGLFIISDSLIAVNMSLLKITSASLWIMITYYAAQFFITLGAARSAWNADG